MDTQKLIKLLNLTQSDSDPEALSAIRKANEIVRENKVLWNSLIKCPSEKFCSHTKLAPKDLQVVDDETIDELLEHPKLKDTAREFVESLKEFYESKKFLTARQEEIFWQIYKRTTKGD